MKKNLLPIIALFIIILAVIWSNLKGKQVDLLRDALQAGNVRIVSDLVSKNPDLMISDLQPERRDHVKPLSFAAGLGQLEICSNLIKLGENINEVDKYRYTPIFHTILSDKTNVAVYLVKNGANLSVKDFENLTPYEMAIKYNASTNMILILAGKTEVDSARQP